MTESPYQFSEKLNAVIEKAAQVGKKSPSLEKKEILFLLEKSSRGERLTQDEIIGLLNCTFDETNRNLILSFASDMSRPHDKEILLLPPLYFSSICENNCQYCDFSSNGNRLTYDDFLAEFDYLTDLGYRSIELVSSQDIELYRHKEPFDISDQNFDIENASKYFELAWERLRGLGGGMLTSNIPPVDTAGFSLLKKAGLSCYLSWMETFNPVQYERLHDKNSPKANQAFRLNSFEDALRAGIDHVAGAFLKGLFDWRQEETVLYELDRYVEEKFGQGFSIIGTPRLKGFFLNSSQVQPYSVSDEDFELNIALDRILFNGILWMQTRESFAFNRKLISRYGGGVILTISCSTAPGGYKNPPRGKAQFPVFNAILSHSIEQLEEDGFTVRFNWDSGTLNDFQRKESVPQSRFSEQEWPK